MQSSSSRLAKLKCNIIQSNPTNAKGTSNLYVLRHRDTYFGVQRQVLRPNMDPHCRKMMVVSFTDRKDVHTFVTHCRNMQKRKMGLNTGVLCNEAIVWSPMENGDRWLGMDAIQTTYADLENICMLHYLDLLIVRHISTPSRILQGIEITYDMPPPAISMRVLNRLYHS